MRFYLRANKGCVEMTQLGSDSKQFAVTTCDVDELTDALYDMLGFFPKSEVTFMASSSMDFADEYGFVNHKDAHRLFDTAWERANQKWNN